MYCDVTINSPLCTYYCDVSLWAPECTNRYSPDLVVIHPFSGEFLQEVQFSANGIAYNN
jgi:hypothetical protein